MWLPFPDASDLVAAPGMAGGGALALMPGLGDAARMAALKAAQAVSNTGMGQEEAHASAELEINDYPQHARWKVTQKDNVAPVTEFNDVCVTAKVRKLCRPDRSNPGMVLPVDVAISDMKLGPAGHLRQAGSPAACWREEALLADRGKHFFAPGTI